MHFVRMLDSEISTIYWRDMLKWMQENVTMAPNSTDQIFGHKDDNPKKQIYYESDGDHDGYWVFTFANESDKVKFILRWL